jgi:hypothetical protein
MYLLFIAHYYYTFHLSPCRFDWVVEGRDLTQIMTFIQVVESDELARCSHLRSNEPVLGLSIADQINVLAVTHLQELQYAVLQKKGNFHSCQHCFSCHSPAGAPVCSASEER